MSKIKKFLNDWKEQGLISSDQVSSVINYEDHKKRTQWVLMGFLSLGVIVLAIGVISIVASNWSDIPDSIKLSVDFLVLIMNGFFIYKFY